MKETRVKISKFLTLLYQTKNLPGLAIALWGAGFLAVGAATNSSVSQQLTLGLPVGLGIGYALSLVNLFTHVGSVKIAVNKKYMRFAENFRTFVKLNKPTEHLAYDKLAQFLILQKDYHYFDLKESDNTKFDELLKKDLIEFIIAGVGKNKEVFIKSEAESQFAKISPAEKHDWVLKIEQVVKSLENTYSFLMGGNDKYEKNRNQIYEALNPTPYRFNSLDLENALDKIVETDKLKIYIGDNLNKQDIGLVQLAKEIYTYEYIKNFNENKKIASQNFVAYLAGALTKIGVVYSQKELKSTLSLLRNNPGAKNFLKSIYDNLQSTEQINHAFIQEWCAKSSSIAQTDMEYYDSMYQNKVREEKANLTYIEKPIYSKAEKNVDDNHRLEQVDFFKNTLTYFDHDNFWSSHYHIPELENQIKSIKSNLQFIAQSTGFMNAEDLIEMKLMFVESSPQIYNYFKNSSKYSVETQNLTLAPTLQSLKLLDTLSQHYREKIENNISKSVLVNAQYLQNKSQSILGSTLPKEEDNKLKPKRLTAKK